MAHEKKQMTILDAIKTLRKERGLSFDQAKGEAIAFWDRKGWPLPTWAAHWKVKHGA